MNLAYQPVHVCLPAPQLRMYVSHYWLSLNNRDHAYSIVPDGSVDVVVVIGATRFG